MSWAELFFSQNILSGVQALWLAQAGAAVGKNWLENILPGAAFPIAIGPEALDDGQYRITAVREGHDASRRVVEEVVHIPQFTSLGVVTSLGDGIHPDFTDTASSPSGSGHPIPDFSIDGRNHVPGGTSSPLCPDIAPFAVSHAEAQTNLINALNSLKQKTVRRANRFWHADGRSSAFSSCRLVLPGPVVLSHSPALFQAIARNRRLRVTFQTGTKRCVVEKRENGRWLGHHLHSHGGGGNDGVYIRLPSTIVISAANSRGDVIFIPRGLVDGAMTLTLTSRDEKFSKRVVINLAGRVRID